MRRQPASRIFMAAVLAVTGYLLYLVFRPFLPGIAWAIVLTVVLRSPYLRLRAKLGDRHWAAAGLITVLVAVLVVVPIGVALTQLAGGIIDGYQWLETRVRSGEPLLAQVESVPLAGRALRAVRGYLDLDRLDLPGMALSAGKTIGTTLARGAGQFAKALLEGVLTALVLLVSLYILLGNGPALVQRFRRFLPLGEKDATEALALLENVTRSVFLGVFATAFLQGILGGIGFAVVGLPHPVMFRAAMMLCALLPGGTFLVWGPAALWLFATDSPWKAIFLALWGLIAVSSSDNFLRPVLIGRGVRIPTSLILVGTIGGLAAWGLIGLFIGPLVITVFQFLLEVARRDLFADKSGAAAPGPGAAGSG